MLISSSHTGVWVVCVALAAGIWGGVWVWAPDDDFDENAIFQKKVKTMLSDPFVRYLIDPVCDLTNDSLQSDPEEFERIYQQRLTTSMRTADPILAKFQFLAAELEAEKLMDTFLGSTTSRTIMEAMTLPGSDPRKRYLWTLYRLTLHR